MENIKENKAGALTFGIEIEVHVPVLQAPKGYLVPKVVDFPPEEWYMKNCLFYTPEDGRKVPVVRDNVKVSKEARRLVWDELLLLFKETMEKPNVDRAPSDIKVVAAETEHPEATFQTPVDKDKETTTSILSSTPDLASNVLGNFVDGHYEVYDTWTVCKDQSGCWYQEADDELFQDSKIPPIGPQQYSWFSIEIKSKVYGDLNALEQDLSKVCERIRSRFLVSVNCGRGNNRSSLHVHVGRSGNWDPKCDNLPFDLISAKKIATVMYLLEPSLMKMHAPWKLKNYRYAALLRGYTHLEEFCNPSIHVNEKYLPIEKEPGPEDTAYEARVFVPDRNQLDSMKCWTNASVRTGIHRLAIETIWGANDMTQLAWLLSCRERSRRGAFALHGLVPTKKDVIRSRHLNTIEFRHMQGSLDIEDIMNWIRIIGEIMNISVLQSGKAYKGLLEKFAYSEEFNFSEVVRGLALRLAIKSEKQIAKETTLPETPGEEDNEEGWKRIAPLMFLRHP